MRTLSSIARRTSSKLIITVHTKKFCLLYGRNYCSVTPPILFCNLHMTCGLGSLDLSRLKIDMGAQAGGDGGIHHPTF